MWLTKGRKFFVFLEICLIFFFLLQITNYEKETIVNCFFQTLFKTVKAHPYTTHYFGRKSSEFFFLNWLKSFLFILVFFSLFFCLFMCNERLRLNEKRYREIKVLLFLFARKSKNLCSLNGSVEEKQE